MTAFFGLSGDGAEIARSYVAWMESQRVPRERIAQHLRWFSAQADRGNLNLERLVSNFVANFPEDAEHAALWHDAFDDGGFELMPAPPTPSPEDDAALLAQTVETLGDEWSAQARLDAETRQAVALNELGPLTPDRKAEIESIMQSDYGRYFADRTMQREYAGLVGAEAWSGEGGTSDAESI